MIRVRECLIRSGVVATRFHFVNCLRHGQIVEACDNYNNVTKSIWEQPAAQWNCTQYWNCGHLQAYYVRIARIESPIGVIDLDRK